jgi:DNA-binding response OmpR family regulator
MTKILFVEDDMHLGELLKENLTNKGFHVVWCNDGSKGYETFKKEQFHLCILDIMMPLRDGFSLSKEIRATDKDIPIIFLTARSMAEDKLKGFELGCDDFITKPFNAQELYMRINAILRRTQYSASNNAEANTLGKFVFDYTKMTLRSGSKTNKLSSKEADLIHILLSNKNKIVQRNEILQRVWGNDDYFSAKSMDVYISKIRKLLKDDPAIEILNAYGIGFKLIVDKV